MLQTYTIKMRKGGCLTIPAPIRRLFNLQDGDWLKVEFRRGTFLVTMLPKAP